MAGEFVCSACDRFKLWLGLGADCLCKGAARAEDTAAGTGQRAWCLANAGPDLAAAFGRDIRYGC